jgi:hypothetical protein
MTLILGIDPGKATGLALYDLDTCKFIHMEETPNGVRGFLHPFLRLQHPDRHVVCEGFTLRASNEFTANLQGVEIIGWLKGEDYCDTFPEPVQHMTLSRLRKNKDKYQDSPVTHLMKQAGFKIGEGHTRMAGSVAMWYAAKVLKHRPTLELLSPRESK